MCHAQQKCSLHAVPGVVAPRLSHCVWALAREALQQQQKLVIKNHAVLDHQYSSSLPIAVERHPSMLMTDSCGRTDVQCMDRYTYDM